MYSYEERKKAVELYYQYDKSLPVDCDKDNSKNPSGSASKMADTVVKIVDLQKEINRDIDELVDLKAEIIRVIKSVSCREYQTILEKRYLCFWPGKKLHAQCTMMCAGCIGCMAERLRKFRIFLT